MEKKGQNPIKKFLGARGVGQVVTVFFGLIALCIVFYIMNPNFLGPRNIPNLLRQIAPFIIIDAVKLAVAIAVAHAVRKALSL